jgi:hypothetical protein
VAVGSGEAVAVGVSVKVGEGVKVTVTSAVLEETSEVLAGDTQAVRIKTKIAGSILFIFFPFWQAFVSGSI